MKYRRMWVLLEGNDDERFFEKVIKPILSIRYDSVQAWKYTQETVKRTKNFLKSIGAMDSGYFFLRDINNSPCITAKKKSVKNKYRRIDINNVIVIVKEIESWYLAGLDSKNCKKLGIKVFRKTDNITKEQFDKLRPRKFNSRIDFMIEILKRFSMETAKRKNKSFDYFIAKI
jgi:hypothetical protein